MYDIKTVIAFFLRKLPQNFAQSQHFPIHTTKRVMGVRSCDWLKIPKFSQRNHLILRWENLGITLKRSL
jgi:hypothetical protein